ncbi:hypothetical protein HCZ97_17155 [Pseudooceanicola sp. HF7]|nr:hypothetical protein [Pseudooceanicola sp. HF7]
MRSVLGKLIARRELRRWRARAEAAEDTHLSTLRGQVTQARDLRGPLDALIQVADRRLALSAPGGEAFDLPFDVDWSWRPEIWRGALTRQGLTVLHSGEELGAEVQLFHDCDWPEVILHQMRNQREDVLAPYCLRMEVFGFEGSFLSLAVNLPQEAATGLTRRHLVSVSADVTLERPVPIYARLNIKHGPNTEQLVEPLPWHSEESLVEFDLAYSSINEKRIEQVWVDIIFDDPAMNAVILRDLTFSRRPRAEL